MVQINPLITAVVAILAISISPGATAEVTCQPDSRLADGMSIDPVASQWAAAWNTGGADAVADLFTPDAAYQDLAFQVTFAGHEGITQWFEITSAVIPDACVEIEHSFRTDDNIAVRWIFSGTPTAIGDAAASGDSFSVPVVTLMKLDGDRIAQVTDAYNLADLLRQIGLPAGPWTPPTP